ncbi:GNAT family N-acetyltransferase [Natronococcus sp. A-GB1]|uniref:GNAT family N-acetyltransferase n=1 Tax=Natronococcus sp. A-GB1 TaxID=3037648 RepID=UPI00241F04D1|nr:GNAT family N-acetyltransferase [Natronococcus sp. A-GB1]MDG5758748.1 GNAT family N-acetyltransferase [Natronococcus sp. A-GB1]
MELRRLEPGATDARAITRVNALAFREAYDGLLPDEVLAGFGADASDEQLREYADRLREDRNGIFLAELEGEVRGYGYVRWGEGTKAFVGPEEAGLKELYVEPDYWGEGIGTALLERCLEVLPGETERLCLETLAGNEVGRRFYEARGFERTGRSEFEIAGEAYPTAIYALELAPER